MDNGKATPARPQTGDALLSCTGIVKTFGGLKALDNIGIDVRAGEIIGLVGPNGSGKTTLVNVVNGFYKPNSGTVSLGGQAITAWRPSRIARQGVARTFQNLALFKGMSVLDNIMLGRHTHMNASALSSLFYWVAAARSEAANRAVVEEVIEFLRLQDIRHETVDTIPLGLQKRIELARALVAQPRLVILDEPMAGMNQEEKENIARYILDARKERGVSVLMIEHHMDVVSALCDRVYVLSYGRLIAAGTPAAALADPAVIEAYLGRSAAPAEGGAA